MRAEAISLSLPYAVPAINQSKDSAGETLGGDFLMALMYAMIQPQVIGTQTPISAEMLDPQTKGPDGGEVINVFLPDFSPTLNDGPVTGNLDELNAGSILENLKQFISGSDPERQDLITAELDLTNGNNANTFAPDTDPTNQPTYSLASDNYMVAATAALPQDVNFGVSDTVESSEGEMVAVETKVNNPLKQDQAVEIGQMARRKEDNIQIPVDTLRNQNPGLEKTPYKSQYPAAETQNTPVQIAIEKNYLTLTNGDKPSNVVLSGTDFAGIVELQNENSQNPGWKGEKEKAIFNRPQEFSKFTLNASTLKQEDLQINPAPAQSPGVSVKQQDSVIVTEVRPAVPEVFGGTEVNTGDKVQGVVVGENEVPVAAQEQKQANTGIINLSNMTPKKFPSEILPHLMNSLQSLNGGQVTVIRLKVEPENMGEIKIRISYAKGKMAAHFYTGSGLVREAIECSLPQLKETLAQYKVDLGEANAYVGNEQQNNGFGSNGFGQNGRMKGSIVIQSGLDSGDRPILADMGDDRKVNLLI